MRPTVLFVDDEPQVTDALKRALRHEAYDMLIAHSAAEGLQILAREPVDVVVSDERMPGMSGSEFLALVRRRYPDTARIILTGHASLEAAVRAINEGEIARFLTKPCNPSELTGAIAHALQRKEREADSPAEAARSEEQTSLLQKLEKENPGITRLNRAPSGEIVLEDMEVDLAMLVRTINAATASGRERMQGTT